MGFFLSCVCYVFVRVCLYVLCGHLLGKCWPLGSRLWCLLWVCHFPIGILGQVWYLIVLIPDLCTLTYFYTEENPYGKSIHTGEEPYIYYSIIVSFIKDPVYKNNPLSNLLVKINYFVHWELLAAKVLLIQCLNYLCSFSSVKLMLIIIKKQHLYFSWLCVLGIQLRF